MGGEQARPRHPVLGRLDDAADRRRRGIELALDQSHPRQAGLWLATPPARLAIRRLGLRELAPQPVQLALLVDGGAHSGLSPLQQSLVRPLRGLERIRPRAVQLHDLGAVDEAIPAERDEVRLRVTPVRQRRRPLLRPAQVQHLLAGLDHAAVDGAGDDLGDLVGDDGDHHLVEQAHPLADPALRDQRPALEVAGERHQIDVGEPIADLGGAAGDRVGGRPVSRGGVLEGFRDQEMALLGAIVRNVFEQATSSRQPAAGAGELAGVEQQEDQPARATGGAQHVAAAQQFLVCALPRLDTEVVLSGEVRRRGQPLEVVRLQRGVWSAADSSATASAHARRSKHSRPRTRASVSCDTRASYAAGRAPPTAGGRRGLARPARKKRPNVDTW